MTITTITLPVDSLVTTILMELIVPSIKKLVLLNKDDEICGVEIKSGILTVQVKNR